MISYTRTPLWNWWKNYTLLELIAYSVLEEIIIKNILQTLFTNVYSTFTGYYWLKQYKRNTQFRFNSCLVCCETNKIVDSWAGEWVKEGERRRGDIISRQWRKVLWRCENWCMIKVQLFSFTRTGDNNCVAFPSHTAVCEQPLGAQHHLTPREHR